MNRRGRSKIVDQSPEYNPYSESEDGEIFEAPIAGTKRGRGPTPGSREWINEKAQEMRKLAAARKGTMKPASDEVKAKPEEDQAIKAIIDKLKNATVLLKQPDTGIIEPKYEGNQDFESYTPPVIPAGLIMDVDSRSKLKTIFQQRSKALEELQREKKLNDVIGEYLRDIDGNKVENLGIPIRIPKTVIFFLTQGLNKAEIDKFVENIGYLHEWIKDFPSMMDWITELQKKPNEFTISDISSQDVTGRIKSLKEELTNLRAVLTNVPVEIKVDKLTGLGKSLYYKIIGGTGVGEAGSTLANLYDKTYRYVCKELLHFSTEEMATINVDPTTLEQVYINYLISGLVVSLLILMLPSCYEILNPYLDAIKSVITSFLVINYSELIGLVVGESLSNVCSIGSQTVENIQKTCQIAIENIEKIIKDLKSIYEHVDEPNSDEVNAPVYISLKELIRQSDMPEHAEERMKKGYDAAEEMRDESQEARSVFKGWHGGKRKSKKAKKSIKRSTRKQKKNSRKSKR
jgi:hypothetical protein